MTKEALFTGLFLGGPAIVFTVYVLIANPSIDRAVVGLVLCMVWAVAWNATLLSPGPFSLPPQPHMRNTSEQTSE
ncbi:MAG: hypothetical protein HYT31_00325 [Parcubacteria group bacterium]|nr:hypothetical protein [Parcubacteria group bacterium]